MVKLWLRSIKNPFKAQTSIKVINACISIHILFTEKMPVQSSLRIQIPMSMFGTNVNPTCVFRSNFNPGPYMGDILVQYLFKTQFSIQFLCLVQMPI